MGVCGSEGKKPIIRQGPKKNPKDNLIKPKNKKAINNINNNKSIEKKK